MRNDLTDITVVMDRSGSMFSCREASERGINEFIKEQKALPGDVTFTLLQFDGQCQYVYRAVPIAKVSRVPLVPRGSTALLDAVGRAVADTGERLAVVPEAQRPGLVIVMIVTDGDENASIEYTKDQIKALIEQQQNVYSWKFMFVGANQDAFAEAGRIGIAANLTANYSTNKTGDTYGIMAQTMGLMRSMTACGQSVNSVSYSDDERKAMA